MLAHEARQAARRVEQVQRDGVRHDFRHQVHDLELEPRFEIEMGFEEIHPLLHRQFGDAHFGDCDDAVGHRRSQPPGGVGRVHVGFGGEAQDHLLALRIADHALENAVENEDLFHGAVALMHQQIALAEISNLEPALQFCAGGRGHFVQDQVLPELQADGVVLRVRLDGRHLTLASVSGAN